MVDTGAGPGSTPGRRRRRRAAGARLHRRARAPDPGRARAAPLRPVRARDPRGLPRRGPRVRRRPPGRASGSSAAAGRCRPSRAARRCAADLDAVVPDRPVFLPNRDHHGAWVNSRALEIAGITSETPDPPDGRIERDADGHPTGTLHEGATALVSRHLPRTTGADYRAALLAGQAYLHSLGVTGWQDAIVGSYSGMDDPGATYVEAAAQRRAPLARRRRALVGPAAGRRAGRGPGRAARGADRGPVPGDERQDHAGRRRRERHRRDARALPRPVRPRRPTTAATPSSTRRRVQDAVAALDAAGFQVHVHAIGDRAVREALDAFGGLDPRRDLRHHIAHLQLVHPDDVPRFAELGVAANMQALWACHDDQMVDLTMPFLGEERSTLAVPLRRPAPRRRPAGRRQRLAGLARPTRSPRSTSRSPARRTATPAGPAPSRSCPSRR